MKFETLLPVRAELVTQAILSSCCFRGQVRWSGYRLIDR